MSWVHAYITTTHAHFSCTRCEQGYIHENADLNIQSELVPSVWTHAHITNTHAHFKLTNTTVGLSSVAILLRTDPLGGTYSGVMGL